MDEVPLWIYFTVALLGGLVGISELVSRYPDSPREAVTTAPGMFYSLINAVAAAAALAVGAVFQAGETGSGLPFSNRDLLTLALISAFGSLAFFRAKVITLRVGDSDVGIGPSFVLETILNAADRAVDRRRAQPRAATASRIMEGVSFEAARVVLPNYCFAVMQNVSVEEQQRIGLEIRALSEEPDMSDKVKALNLGLLLLNIVGEVVLDTAVKNLEGEFAASSKLPESVEKTVALVDFDRASINLVSLCAELGELSDEDRDQMLYEIERLRTAGLGEQTRKYLLGLVLFRAVGSEVLENAAKLIQSEIQEPDAGEEAEVGDPEPQEPARDGGTD